MKSSETIRLLLCEHDRLTDIQ